MPAYSISMPNEMWEEVDSYVEASGGLISRSRAIATLIAAALDVPPENQGYSYQPAGPRNFSPEQEEDEKWLLAQFQDRLEKLENQWLLNSTYPGKERCHRKELLLRAERKKIRSHLENEQNTRFNYEFTSLEGL